MLDKFIKVLQITVMYYFDKSIIYLVDFVAALFVCALSKAHSEPSRPSQSDLFAKIVSDWNTLTIFAKSSMVDVWQGPVCASGLLYGIFTWWRAVCKNTSCLLAISQKSYCKCLSDVIMTFFEALQENDFNFNPLWVKFF